MDASQVKIIDRELALERAGGSAELAEELLGMLVQELPRQRAQLENAAHEHDLERVRDIAHKIKGSSTYCGTPALRIAAETVERHIKQGQTAHTDDELNTLLHEIHRLLDEIAA